MCKLTQNIKEVLITRPDTIENKIAVSILIPKEQDAARRHASC